TPKEIGSTRIKTTQSRHVDPGWMFVFCLHRGIKLNAVTGVLTARGSGWVVALGGLLRVRRRPSGQPAPASALPLRADISVVGALLCAIQSQQASGGFRHALSQVLRVEHLDIQPEPCQLKGCMPDRLNRDGDPHPAVSVCPARRSRGGFGYIRSEHLKLFESRWGNAEFRLEAVKTRFVGVRGDCPKCREIDICRPFKSFSEHLELIDMSDLVSPYLVSDSGHEVPDAALQHESKRLHLAGHAVVPAPVAEFSTLVIPSSVSEGWQKPG